MRTRQYILEAAERMLQSKGLARLTNKEIAKAAGCAEGTLYKHFETKEDLILSAIEEHLPDFLVVVQDDRIGHGSLEANVQDIAQAAIRYYQKLVPLATSLFADMELLARFRHWMQEQQAGPLNLYELVAGYIEAEQRVQCSIGPRITMRSCWVPASNTSSCNTSRDRIPSLSQSKRTLRDWYRPS